MDVPTRQGSGEIAHAGGEYLDWSPEGAPVSIQMHLDAIDGIRRDVIESTAEVGGLLLGSVESGDHPSVRIDRCQRIPCGHRLGPQFTLDREDQAALVSAAEGILKTGDLSVVGLYRSHTRPGLDLDPADAELMARYFSDPFDLMLLVKPESTSEISARFFGRGSAGAAQPIGPAFPFRGRALSLPLMNSPDLEEEQTARSLPVKTDAPERPRRLVPDFVPSVVEPSHTFRPEPVLITDTSSTVKRERSWWPLLAAIMLVGGGAFFLLKPNHPAPPNPAPAVTTPAADRPLGLYVDPAGRTWHVSWNSNATALHDARTVQLFVREGDDQNRVDLSRDDLAAGMYQYKPGGSDVTFRLEVTENSGHVSAESFRVTRSAAPPAAVPAAAPQPPPLVPSRVTEPRATHKVPPVIPLSIKPRIKSPIPIDVRVHIDAAGRVTSATPVTKPPSGLHAYLARKAVEAARLWRFDPARDNGRPVPGTETIHFVFEN